MIHHTCNGSVVQPAWNITSTVRHTGMLGRNRCHSSCCQAPCNCCLGGQQLQAWAACEGRTVSKGGVAAAVQVTGMVPRGCTWHAPPGTHRSTARLHRQSHPLLALTAAVRLGPLSPGRRGHQWRVCLGQSHLQAAMSASAEEMQPLLCWAVLTLQQLLLECPLTEHKLRYCCLTCGLNLACCAAPSWHCCCLLLYI